MNFSIWAGTGFGPRYLDQNGQPVRRTREEYPYSYDPYVTWRGGKTEDANGVVYSDRLYQWDWEKYNRLCRRHFGNEGQMWGQRQPERIEAFLRDYNEDPDLRLVLVMEGCNASNGYPYWVFYTRSGQKTEVGG